MLLLINDCKVRFLNRWCVYFLPDDCTVFFAFLPVSIKCSQGLNSFLLPTRLFEKYLILPILVCKRVNNHLTSGYCHLNGSKCHLDGHYCHLDGSYCHLDSYYCHLDGNYWHLDGDYLHLDGDFLADTPFYSH